MLTPSARQLVDLMGQAPRGPRREGLFALWMTVRILEELDLSEPHLERATRRRVALLERRLSSLALPVPLIRSLGRVIEALKVEPAPNARLLLSQLVGSTREALGPEAGDALQKAIRTRR